MRPTRSGHDPEASSPAGTRAPTRCMPSGPRALPEHAVLDDAARADDGSGREHGARHLGRRPRPSSRHAAPSRPPAASGPTLAPGLPRDPPAEVCPEVDVGAVGHPRGGDNARREPRPREQVEVRLEVLLGRTEVHPVRVGQESVHGVPRLDHRREDLRSIEIVSRGVARKHRRIEEIGAGVDVPRVGSSGFSWNSSTWPSRPVPQARRRARPRRGAARSPRPTAFRAWWKACIAVRSRSVRMSPFSAKNGSPPARRARSRSRPQCRGARSR